MVDISAYKQFLRDTSPRAYNYAKRLNTLIDDAVYNMRYGSRTPKVGSNAVVVKKGGTARQALNTMYKKPTSMVNKMAQEGLTKQGVKQAVKKGAVKGGSFALKEVAPFTSDVWDIYSGYKKIQDGHPWLGVGQIGLGVLGGITDTLSLGGDFTAKAAARQLLKHAVKAGIKAKAIKSAGKALSAGAKTAAVGDIAYDLLRHIRGGNNSASDLYKEDINAQPQLDGSNYVPSENPLQGYKGLDSNGNYIGGQGQHISSGQSQSTDDVQKVLNQYQQPTQQSNLVKDNSTQNSNDEQQSDTGKLDKLLQIYAEQQKYMEPYREGLKSYIDNFDTLNKDRFNLDRMLIAKADLQDNDNILKLRESYNPVDVNARKLDLMKALAGEQISNLEGYNRLVGNAAMAKYANIPEEAVLADPAFVQKMATIANAKTNAEARMAAAELNNETKMKIAYLNNRIKAALKAKDIRAAQQLQSMKNDVKLKATYLSNIPFTNDPSMLTNVMNQYGYNIKTPVGSGGTQTGGNPNNPASKLFN